MSISPRLSSAGLVLVASALLAGPLVAVADARTDWDLYSMRLVNRARLDPAGEAARIGSAVVDTTAPRPPLAYAPIIADAAANHTDWMHDNLGTITGSCFPASFTHRETLDCSSGGTPATGTPSFTGVSAGDRIDFAGYAWSSWGENIFVTWSTANIAVSQARIDSNHLWWWESQGHRANFLSANYAVYGHHIETRPFLPPLGGLNPPFDNIQLTTQNFSRPQGSIRTHVFGLLYDDLDGNDEWTPRDTGHPMREGLGGVVVEVHGDGAGGPPIASATSDDTGAFAIVMPDGLYEVIIRFPGGDVPVSNVQIVGENVDLGDHRPGPSTCPGDIDGSGGVGFSDLNILLGAWGICPTPPPFDCTGDLDGDLNVGFTDLSLLLAAWGPC